MPCAENPCLELGMPSWAIRPAKGELVAGAHLPTRDGRRTGNAHIVGIADGCLGSGRLVYTVLTDAGSVMRLLAEEITEYFYPPQWVSDVFEVTQRFGRPPEPDKK